MESHLHIKVEDVLGQGAVGHHIDHLVGAVQLGQHLPAGLNESFRKVQDLGGGFVVHKEPVGTNPRVAEKSGSQYVQTNR